VNKPHLRTITNLIHNYKSSAFAGFPDKTYIVIPAQAGIQSM